jgi:Bacterial Ig-like domain
MAQNNAAAIKIDKAYRFASKAPALDISSSDPTDTDTGVPVSKTITLTFSMPLQPSSVDNTNITISPNVARTTTLDAVNHRIVTIDPTSNLAASTTYTVTMTTGLRGLYEPWILKPTATDSISFTTA